MKEFKYVVTDPEGIHARPAGMLVKAVKEFSCDIKIAKDGKAMNCKAIFGIMGLAVKQGEEVTLTFDGADEDARHAAEHAAAERHCEGDLCLSSHRSCPHRSPTPLKPLLRLECRFPCF